MAEATTAQDTPPAGAETKTETTGERDSPPDTYDRVATI
jgi:hypothetical protein